MPRNRPHSILFFLVAAVTFASTIAAVASNDWRNLVFIETIYDGDGGVVVGLDGANSVAVSPDGKHVYVASSIANSVVVFSRDAASGVLSFVEAETDDSGVVDGLQGARSVAVSPDGNHVYVAGFAEDKVAIFIRHSSTGGLTWDAVVEDGVALTDNINGPSHVMVSPDGGWVFVCGQSDSSVAAFLRNPSNGRLLYISAVRDDDPGVDGLFQTAHGAVSPDGKHIYVTSTGTNKVAALEHNSTTGVLTFVGSVEDGVGFVDGLDGARGVVVSPDGNHVYVSSMHDSAVAIFTRTPSSGALGYVGMLEHGVGGVEGLHSPRDIAISPDGKLIYIPSGGPTIWVGTLALFGRTQASGLLYFMEAVTNKTGPIVGLGQPVGVAVSPDGRHVYTVSPSDNALMGFLISFTGFFLAESPVAGAAVGAVRLPAAVE
jgi:6-phosphogluconolactonase (cycloisomerase 2 family)